MQEQWELNWQDYYKILQVCPDAEPEVIEVVYKRLSLKYHPDHNTGAGDYRMKDLNKAYEVLKCPERRKRYHSEWSNRNIKAPDSQAPYTHPKPPKSVVEPGCLEFKDVSSGEIQRASFVIRNIGGPYKKIKVWVSKPDTWTKVVSRGPLDPHQTEECPLLVNITAEGKDWNTSYKAHIYVTLDEEKTQVEVKLQTKPRPAPKGTPFRRKIMNFLFVNNSPAWEALQYTNRGSAYGMKGEHDRAFEDFDRALEINPRYAYAYYNRACVYSIKDEKEKALSNLKKAIELDVSLREIAKTYTDEDFKNLRANEDFKRLIGQDF